MTGPAHHVAPRRRRRAGQYFASAARIAAQLRADPRTIAIVLVMPLILITLLYFVFVDARHHRASPTRSSGSGR